MAGRSPGPQWIFSPACPVARALDRRVDFPPRANIYDRNGKSLAEEAGQVYSLYVIKQDMPDVEDCLATLSEATLQQISSLRGIFANYLAETRFHVAEMDPERYARYSERLMTDCAITRTGRPLQQGTDLPLAQLLRSWNRHASCRLRRRGAGLMSLSAGRRAVARPGDLVGRAGIELSYEDALAGTARNTICE